MAQKSRSALITEIDATIFDNNSNLIEAGNHNSLLKNVNDSLVNFVTDETDLGLWIYETGGKVYKQNQYVMYENELYVCTAASTFGVWTPAHWQKVIPRTEGGRDSVVTGTTTISFLSAIGASSADWTFTGKPWCYNANGEIGFEITNQDQNGFDVTPLEDATFEWSVIKI